MVKLEDIKKDAQIRGLHVDKVGDSAISVVYQKSAGGYGDQMLFRDDEPRLELAQAG